jgi:hypothetical protein
LLHADSEEAATKLLEKAGFWDDARHWRLLGDDENNFKTVGSQQAKPESALVEKIVNSVDARLTGACLRAGIDPTSANAPQTIWMRERNFSMELIAPNLQKQSLSRLRGDDHSKMECLV